MAKFQAPKGTRDFYPEAMALRNWIADLWRRVSIRNGFVEYDGPTFEYLDLYRLKSGDEIVEQLFHFTDRGGREFALRPEMTPTLARMVAARAQGLPKPIKWFCLPAMFRAERPQRGRLREFIQWNVDILGADDVMADAECVYVAVDQFRELGLQPEHVSIKISSRRLVASLLQVTGIGPEQHNAVYAVLDKRDKIPEEVFRDLLTQLGLAESQQQTLVDMSGANGPAGLESMAQVVHEDETGRAEVDRLRECFALLASMGVGDYCRFDMGVVRGLAYYTSIVFEAFGYGGLKRAVCGGGRYDELLRQVGGPPMSGVGFATSDVVIGDLLEEFSVKPEVGGVQAIFLIDADPVYFDRLLHLADRMRRSNIPAVFSYKRQTLVKQLKQATSQGIDRVCIVDQASIEHDQVGVKDMVTGVQKSLPIEAMLLDPFQTLGSNA